MTYLRICLAALLLGLLLPAAALAQGDSYRESYDLEIHMGGFMDRLYNVLTSPEHLGKHAEVAGTAQLLKRLGYFELESAQCQYRVQDGNVGLRWATHFEGLDPASYFGQVFALPNKPLQLASYVPDDALLYVGINNVPQQALLAVRELGAVAAEAQGSESGLGEMFEDADIAQVLGMLDAFDVESQVNEVLTGEVGLAFFAAPDAARIASGSFTPNDLNAALLVGVKDAARVKQLIGMAGANAPLAPMGELAGGWTGWYVTGHAETPNAGVMLGSDMLILTPNVQTALGSLDFSRQGQSTPACQSYIDFNLARLHDELAGPGLNALMSEMGDLSKPQATARYLFNLPPSDQLGHITAVTVYDSGYECALTMNTALANYLFYYVGTGLAGMADAELSGAGAEEGGE
jgi:hypothetical protein